MYKSKEMIEKKKIIWLKIILVNLVIGDSFAAWMIAFKDIGVILGKSREVNVVTAVISS